MALTFKALVAAHLVVKNTFLDFEPVPEQPVLRRSKSCPVEQRSVEHYHVDQVEQVQVKDSKSYCTLKVPSSSSLISTRASSRSSSPDALSHCESCSAFAPSPRARGDDQTKTTIMLRHMPNNYTSKMFLALLDREGFAGQYDFVYLPMDFKRDAGLGYAFVNLSDQAAVQRFWQTFDGFRRWDFPTQKVCELSWSAPLQGLQAHIQRFRNLPVMHDSVPEHYKPMLFENGCRIPFPPPTKTVKAPFRKA